MAAGGPAKRAEEGGARPPDDGGPRAAGLRPGGPPADPAAPRLVRRDAGRGTGRVLAPLARAGALSGPRLAARRPPLAQRPGRSRPGPADLAGLVEPRRGTLAH